MTMRAPWNRRQPVIVVAIGHGMAGALHPNPLPLTLTFTELRARRGVVDAQYLASYARHVPGWALPVIDTAYGVTWTWLAGRAWWAAVKRRRARLIARREYDRTLSPR